MVETREAFFKDHFKSIFPSFFEKKPCGIFKETSSKRFCEKSMRFEANAHDPTQKPSCAQQRPLVAKVVKYCMRFRTVLVRRSFAFTSAKGGAWSLIIKIFNCLALILLVFLGGVDGQELQVRRPDQRIFCGNAGFGKNPQIRHRQGASSRIGGRRGAGGPEASPEAAAKSRVQTN